MIKNLSLSAGDSGETVSIPGSGRSPGVGNGNSFQNSCLGNAMDRGTWLATVRVVRVRQQRASTVGAEPDRKILQTMWKYFPDVNCYKSFFLCNFIFFYVSGSPKHAHY